MCFPGNQFLEPFTSRSPPPVSCALLGPSHLALLSHHRLSGGSLLKSENNCFCHLAALLDGLNGVKDWKNYRANFLSLSRWDISAWGWEVQSWKYRVGSSANQINLLRDSSSEPDIFPFPHPLESPANRDVASNHTFQNKADLSSPPREQFKISWSWTRRPWCSQAAAEEDCVVTSLSDIRGKALKRSPTFKIM